MKRIIYAIAVLLVLCAAMSVNSYAEARSVYVGDIITLNISSGKISEEELRQSFSEFEIVEIKKESDGYKISMRTFSPGEYSAVIGDKELVIQVGSTLTDIAREDIFEPEPNIVQPGLMLRLGLLLYVSAGAFALAAVILLIRFIRRRIAKPESPYRHFMRRASTLCTEDANYLVDLTMFFKEYIEAAAKRPLIGKTSPEIVADLKQMRVFEHDIPEIRSWLAECDVYKFSGKMALDNEKHRHYLRLVKIVENMEQNISNVNEGSE